MLPPSDVSLSESTSMEVLSAGPVTATLEKMGIILFMNVPSLSFGLQWCDASRVSANEQHTRHACVQGAHSNANMMPMTAAAAMTAPGALAAMRVPVSVPSLVKRLCTMCISSG
jgi:hypothetical protein